MKSRATPSSSQALTAAELFVHLTGVCARGDHQECGGRVYAGHAPNPEGREVATFHPCECTCHHALPQAA